MDAQRRIREIRARHALGDPLNLSAVRMACPDLLEGLFEAADFRGWRESLEAAGLSYDTIHISPLADATCLICGARDYHLGKHLKHFHGINAEEYREQFPDGEVMSEEARRQKMGNRYGSASRVVLPHWEPAWSRLYALDRLHHYRRLGYPMNRAYWTINEPSLEGFLRRLYTYWDPALEAIGLNPAEERAARKSPNYDDKAKIRAQLAAVAAKDPTRLRPGLLSKASEVVLIRSAILTYGNYETALEDAGVDIAAAAPAYQEPGGLRRRDRTLAEGRRWLRDNRVRDLKKQAALYRKFDEPVRMFFGSWSTFIALLGSSPLEFFNAPSTSSFPTRESVIRALKQRQKAGLPMLQSFLHVDDAGLYERAVAYFGTLAKAMKAAGVTLTPHAFGARHYKTPKSVLEALKSRAAAGRSMFAVTFFEDSQGRILHKWCRRYFGTFEAAMTAAGLSFERKPKDGSAQIIYPDSAAVLDAIRKRAQEGASLNRHAMAGTKATGGDMTLCLAAAREFGGWPAALFEAGINDVDHGAPGEMENGKLRTKAQAIAALQAEHRASGLAPNASSPLTRQVSRLFGNLTEALVAAGLLDRATAGPAPYGSPQETLTAMRDRVHLGKPLDLTAMLAAHRGDLLLAEAARRHFGSWHSALAEMKSG